MQLARVGLFCAVIVLAYYFAVRWVIDRRRRSEPNSRFARLFERAGPIFIALAIVGLLCFAYGFLIAPSRLTVTFHEIRTPKLPTGERVRIVHLADLHVRKEGGQRERRLVELVQSFKPDVILHSGDFFGAGNEIEGTVVSLLRSWSVPQFTCKGNLDFMADFEDVMKKTGITVLSNQAETLTIRQAKLTVAGFPENAATFMQARLRELPRDTFTVVLHHIPGGFPYTWDTAADLMLAGHTHGGQVCLPFYGALITLDPYGKRWESGRFDENGATLIVSRGIGCEPHAPEMRFWCPPEVVVIDVVGK